MSLPVTVQDISFPMCLVAASVGQRRAVRPRTESIPAWPLHQVPRALTLCSVEMPSGHMLFPFADSPHITQEGFIVHGSNPETRAKVYRLLLRREIISNPREAAQEVLLHLGWIQEAGIPTRVFPFNSLQYLEHRPTLPPAKRGAALWLTPQPECPQVPRPPPHFQVYRPPPAGQQGIYASQVSLDDSHEPTSSSSHYDDRPQYQLPFMSLAQEAARRIPFIKTAAGNIMDLLRDCPPIGNGVAQRQAARAVHEIYQEMLELEEALGQLH